MEIEAQVLTLPDGEPLIVRTATAEDAPATLALFRSVVDEGLFTVREPSEFDVTEDEERGYIEEDRVASGNLRLVATEGDDAVVGMVRATAGTYKRTGHFADIDDSLWVDASWRRLGVAAGLLSALVSWAPGPLGAGPRGHREAGSLRLLHERGGDPALQTPRFCGGGSVPGGPKIRGWHLR